jgi:hypothetical protein
MSIAWTTVVVIALLVPGVFFFIGLATYERLSRDIIRSGVISELAMAIVVAVAIHTISLSLLGAAGFRLSQFLAPLADYDKIPHSQLLPRLIDHLLPAAVYLGVTSIGGLALGVLAAVAIVSGPLRFLATHKWIYDIVDADRKGRIVTAFVMTNTAQNNRVLMYKGRVHELFLGPDGKLSYVALRNGSRYYMMFDGTEPTTSTQLELLGAGQITRSTALWDHLLIDGSNIANILFDSSPEIGETGEGEQALDKALERIRRSDSRPDGQAGATVTSPP